MVDVHPSEGETSTMAMLMVILKRLWPAPVTLIGALLSLSFRRRRFKAGVILAEGATWPRRLGWRYRAITLGHTVLSVDELDERTFQHELVHVRQFERWGPLFLIIYPAASAVAKIRGQHGYRDNRFEIAARGAESPTEGLEA